MRSAKEIAQALGGKRAGRTDSFVCCCPAHEDRSPSLSVADKGGKVLLHCHADCEQAAVIAALRDRGLWEGSPTRKATPSLGPIIAEYIYTDEQHWPLIRVTRHAPKDFRQWRPDGAGGWISGIGDLRRPLYRLPEVIEAAIVFVVEGEKDVESLRAMGFVATCNLMGAGKWRSEYNEVFAGKTVILIPDTDKAGKTHAKTVYAGVKPFAAEVLYLDLETAKDVSEWFEQGHSEVELVKLLERHWSKAEVAHG